MAEPIVQARNLCKSYASGADPVPVLKRLDFSIAPGEYLAILGPSGCGKSTLLNILGLMDTPDSGDILFKGQPTANLSEEKKSLFRNQELGFIFQFDSLLPDFSILENIMMPSLIAHAARHGSENRTAIRSRALSLLDGLGLESLQNRFPSQTSGGERQRAALCRALMNRPSIILADEPTGNLDKRNGEIVFKDLKNLAEQHNTAIVMVTHNEAACRFAHRTLHMSDGIIEGNP